MVSNDRLVEVLALVQDKGIEYTKNVFNLKEDTIRRYADVAKDKGLEIANVFPLRDFPRVFVFDIEMSSVSFRLWRAGKQYVSPYDQVNNKFCITWVGKWLDTDKEVSSVCTPEEAKARCDRRIIEDLHKELNQADIIIGHNILGYDLKQVRTKFVEYGLNPISTPNIIDTYRHAKKTFGFIGNGLDYLCKYFGFSGKIKTDKQLWIDCEQGETKALEDMHKYCRQDVLANIDLYLMLRPYMKSHPNFGVFIEKDNICPVCLSQDIEPEGFYYTRINKYQQFRCKSCNHLFRSGKPEKWRDNDSLRLRSNSY